MKRAGVVGCVLPSCVQGLAELCSRGLGVGENKAIGDWSSFCQSLCFSFWLALGFTIGGGFVTVVDVHPSVHFPSRGRARWVGDGVGDCHDAADLQREGLFIFPLNISGAELCSFFKGMFFFVVYCLLCMLGTKREPTPGYSDAYSVDTLKWAFWKKNRKTTLSPLFGRVFWLRGLFSFSGSW